MGADQSGATVTSPGVIHTQTGQDTEASYTLQLCHDDVSTNQNTKEAQILPLSLSEVKLLLAVQTGSKAEPTAPLSPSYKK